MKLIERLIPFLFALLALSSCGETGISSSAAESIKISFVSSEYVSVSSPTLEIARGKDVVVSLTFKEGLAYASCSYNNSSYLSQAENQGVLTLYQVRYPQQIAIQVAGKQATLVYDANGGRLLSGTGETFYGASSLKNHPRVNTSRGIDVLTRSGYQQIAWNSKADGTGEEIGLGSRTTVSMNGVKELHAQWLKTAAEEDFSYREEKDGSVTLTGYSKTPEEGTLALPSTIAGKKVKRLASKCFKNLTLKTLVLPPELETLDPQAFSVCEITDFYCWDLLLHLTDDSFASSSVKTLHLNAFQKPCYLAGSDNCVFADDMDRLLLAKGQKKMLFFGGCSMSYGLNSELIQKEFIADYHVLNLGVVGGTNALFQFQIITPLLDKGDIFVHAPEEGSPYQLMHSVEAEIRMFTCLEGNYDLWREVSLAQIPGFWTQLGFYDQSKISGGMTPGDYEDTTGHYNAYGDISFARENAKGDIGFSEGVYTYHPEYGDDSSLAALCSCYDAIRAQGAEVYFSYAPMNYSNLTKEDRSASLWQKFAAIYEPALKARGYACISEVAKYLYPGRYFYDSDYHLTTAGAELRTLALIADLKKALGEN